jgi:Sulfotransferase domain
MKMFGIGLPKTVTKSLAASLIRLGYRHLPWSADKNRALMRLVARGDLSTVFEVADGHDSFEDWPWPLIYRELARRYTDARFILTLRKGSRTWFQSLVRHSEETGPSETRQIVYGYAMPHGREKEHVAIYESHNREVRRHFTDLPGRLLDVCWETGSGWQQLGSFLDRLVPEDPFPHENQSQEACQARRPKSA